MAMCRLSYIVRHPTYFTAHFYIYTFFEREVLMRVNIQ